MKRIALVVVIVAIVAGAWLFRDRIGAALRNGGTTGTRSADAAASAEAKLTALRNGSADSAAFSAIEIESALFERYGNLLPEFMDSTRIEMRADQLRLRARVPTDKLPAVNGLADVLPFLPDTTDWVIAGRLTPLDSGRIAFNVDDVSAERIPMPDRIVTAALRQLGRRDEAGLPADAVAVALPPGIAAAHVRQDSLVLVRR